MAFPSVNDLTARLENLEQNITLTLQEIDNNFSICQHKVSTRILPQISRFAEVSEDIWENSKLWWSFFESLDLSSSNDNSSPPSMDYINSKKKIFDNLSNSKENNTVISDISSNSKENNTMSNSKNSKNSKSADSKKEISDSSSNSKENNMESNSKNSKSTDSSIYPPSAKYLSISSTPLQEPPKLEHKLLQSPPWGEKIPKKKGSGDHSHATTSTYISMPALDRKPNTLIERVMQRQQMLARQTPLKPIIEKNPYKGTNSRPSTYFPGGPPSSRGTDSDFAEFSPPVTIQFSVAPSKLMKTPAKEAAKIIVDDLISILSPVPPTPPISVGTEEQQDYENEDDGLGEDDTFFN
ncbi:12412_t:CDS:2, partial [Dentiscutata erythropus]